MEYSREETLKHLISKAYPDCVMNFDQVVLAEDDNLCLAPNVFINAEVVINLDCVEKVKSVVERRNRNKTMDCAFAISNLVLTRILLIELRFNYRNLANLKRTELLEKVNGSLSVLGNSVPIDSDYIFVFQKNLVEQARSRLQRMNPRIPNNYIPMSLDQIQGTYFNSISPSTD